MMASPDFRRCQSFKVKTCGKIIRIDLRIPKTISLNFGSFEC